MNININKNLIIFLILFISFFQYNFAKADVVDDINAQIQQISNAKAEIQKEIDAYQQQLKTISAQSDTLSNAIKSLDATINKNALDIKLTQKNIDSAQLQIEQLSRDIGKNTKIIDQDTKSIALLINQVNIYDKTTFIENLLTYNNLSEFWNEQQSIFLVQNELRDKINESKNTKIVLQNNKKATENKKADLLKYKSSLEDQKNLTIIAKNEKSKLLADTKNSEANYKKLLADKQALADSFDKELNLFQAQLNISYDPKTVPAAQRGILYWPLASIKITQRFGMTEFAKTTNAYNGQGHNGVDFAAPIGTPIYAVSEGVVIGTGNTDTVCPGASFGKWAFVKHTNGLSTIYAHMSLIKVSVGDIVSTGSLIGYAGLTGFTTGPHLHFGLYVTQGSKVVNYKSKVCKGTYSMPVADLKAYLDPLQYLPSL